MLNRIKLNKIAAVMMSVLSACASAESIDQFSPSVEIDRLEVSVQVAGMVGADQALRFGEMHLEKNGHKLSDISSHPNFQNKLGKIDAENAKRIKKIIQGWGWPTISEFGFYTAHNVWLLVQHMDQDVEFQKACLEKMKSLLPEGELIKEDFGYLYDRVQVNSKNKQKYGTQGKCIGENSWEPSPIENPDLLDQRRREMGMSPMKDYIAKVQAYCS